MDNIIKTRINDSERPSKRLIGARPSSSLGWSLDLFVALLVRISGKVGCPVQSL